MPWSSGDSLHDDEKTSMLSPSFQMSQDQLKAGFTTMRGTSSNDSLSHL